MKVQKDIISYFLYLENDIYLPKYNKIPKYN